MTITINILLKFVSKNEGKNDENFNKKKFKNMPYLQSLIY